MLRIDLLRSLPRSAPSERSAPVGRLKQSAPSTEASDSGSPGPVKPILVALLLLLAGGILAVWFTKPEWLKFDRVTELWTHRGSARADSVRHADLLHRQASSQIAARQSAAVEWLTELEAVLPVAQSFGTLTLSGMTYSTSGAFILEGNAASAEALSAFQEALVLVPEMELAKSRAMEDPTRGGHFSFRFEGRIVPNQPDSADQTADGTNDSKEGRSRIFAAETLPDQLDSLISTASQNGFSFSRTQSLKAPASRLGALNAHSYRLKGAPTLSETARDSAIIVGLRNLVNQEMHRGSPFAFQRITIKTGTDSSIVFLDILALTP